MTAPVAVRILYPDGTSESWTTGTQVILADGVEPLTPAMLGGIVGVLTAVGILIPRDDEAVCFDSTVPREVIEASPLGSLAFFDADCR